MPLTDEQTKLIDKHLRVDNWMLNKELLVELTDHYYESIIDRMGRGQSFTEAINAVHAEFGGRKGLIKLEEDFTKSQHQDANRMLRAALLSYFQWPRLGFTLVMAVLVIGLSISNVMASYMEYALYFVVITSLGHFVIMAGMQAYKHLKNQSNTLHKQHVQALMFGYNMMVWVVVWPRFFLGKDYDLFANVWLTALLLITIIIYEAAVVIYLKHVAERTHQLQPKQF